MSSEHTISISTGTFFKAVLIILGLWFLWYIRDIVAMFVVAIMLSSLIDPFADWFSKHRIPRGLAVLIVYTVLLALASVLIIVMIPVVVQQSGQLVENLSSNSTNLVNTFVQFQQRHQFLESFTSGLQSFQQSLNTSANSVFSTVKGFFGGVAAVLIVLVLTFYMVVEEDSMRRYFKTLAPEEYQPYLMQLMKKMQDKIGAWLRGQLILGFFVGLAVYIGLKFLGVPYALLLALIAGVLEIVPYVGPIISLIPAGLIGFAQSPVLGLAVVVLYLVIQQIENNVLVPKIMQTVTGLNPILSIAALLVGVQVGGFVGALLAIPLATMVAVVAEDVFKGLV
ncbi:AI-2E family transporter [Candidatus Uhrbacteria bacterium]|nr:AI-2E family transporter [Candidatus Uhrbacteria bacterium]